MMERSNPGSDAPPHPLNGSTHGDRTSYYFSNGASFPAPSSPRALVANAPATPGSVGGRPRIRAFPSSSSNGSNNNNSNHTPRGASSFTPVSVSSSSGSLSALARSRRDEIAAGLRFFTVDEHARMRTQDDIRKEREKKGYCTTCPDIPVCLYERSRLYRKKIARNEPGLSENGVCLLCNPPGGLRSHAAAAAASQAPMPNHPSLVTGGNVTTLVTPPVTPTPNYSNHHHADLQDNLSQTPPSRVVTGQASPIALPRWSSMRPSSNPGVARHPSELRSSLPPRLGCSPPPVLAPFYSSPPAMLPATPSSRDSPSLRSSRMMAPTPSSRDSPGMRSSAVTTPTTPSPYGESYSARGQTENDHVGYNYSHFPLAEVVPIRRSGGGDSGVSVGNREPAEGDQQQSQPSPRRRFSLFRRGGERSATSMSSSDRSSSHHGNLSFVRQRASSNHTPPPLRNSSNHTVSSFTTSCVVRDHSTVEEQSRGERPEPLVDPLSLGQSFHSTREGTIVLSVTPGDIHRQRQQEQRQVAQGLGADSEEDDETDLEDSLSLDRHSTSSSLAVPTTLAVRTSTGSNTSFHLQQPPSRHMSQRTLHMSVASMNSSSAGGGGIAQQEESFSNIDNSVDFLSELAVASGNSASAAVSTTRDVPEREVAVVSLGTQVIADQTAVSTDQSSANLDQLQILVDEMAAVENWYFLAETLVHAMKNDVWNAEVQIFCLESIEQFFVQGRFQSDQQTNDQEQEDTRTSAESNSTSVIPTLVRVGVQSVVVQAMREHSSSSEVLAHACPVIGFLAHRENVRSVLVNAGVCGILWQAIMKHRDDSTVVARALSAIRVFSLEEKARRIWSNTSSDCVLTPALVQAMQVHPTSKSIQRDGCAVLSNLAVDLKEQAVAPADLETLQCIAACLESQSQSVLASACFALKNFTYDENNLESVARLPRICEQLTTVLHMEDALTVLDRVYLRQAKDQSVAEEAIQQMQALVQYGRRDAWDVTICLLNVMDKHQWSPAVVLACLHTLDHLRTLSPEHSSVLLEQWYERVNPHIERFQEHTPGDKSIFDVGQNILYALLHPDEDRKLSSPSPVTAITSTMTNDALSHTDNDNSVGSMQPTRMSEQVQCDHHAAAILSLVNQDSTAYFEKNSSLNRF